MQLQQANERAFREFYDQWSRSVWALCRFLLGEQAAAEKAAREALLAYFRARNIDDDDSPSKLLILALEHAKKYCSVPKSSGQPAGLSEAIQLLPCKERAVFILRGVLDLDERLVSVITELSVPELRRCWFRALMEIRAGMPSKFFQAQRA